ncbi:MAG: succinate dehydrogenase cytochrome b subunit [Bryobacteraceae bacterium]
MSATAPGIAGVRVLRLWNTAIGKKAVMAVSGIVLAGFIAVHLLGNLQIFLGPEQFNGYSRTLHNLPELLWTARVVLIVMVVLHIWSSIQLAVLKSEARPRGYKKWQPAGSSYASRTMYWSGPIILAFVIYHLMQFTFGTGGTPYNEFDPYGNVIAGFRVPAVSIFYIVAMALLCLHLRHGLWSMLQSLGLVSQERAPKLKRWASIAALVVFLGFVAIPVSVALRVIPRVI